MSGIAGIINFDGRPVPHEEMIMMTSAMHYRAKDGTTHWPDKASCGAALSYCQLQSTPESLVERQPVSSEDGALVMVMDGRVDNWVELRERLLSKGRILRNRSDAELVLQAYKLWGRQCLENIDGDFALAIWHTNSRHLFCARDPIGNKPFHFHWNGTSLVFASDLHAVLAVPDVPEIPNEGVLAEYLADEWISRTETLWQGVNSLDAAHYMEVDARGPKTRQYWSPDPFATLHYAKDSDYIEHYRELFTDIVRRQSRSQNPISIEVSGGLDSSAIFAMAAHLNNHDRLASPGLTGYTLNFSGDTDADEIDYARAVGAHLDLPIREIEPAYPDFSSYLKRAGIYRDLPGYPNTAMFANELAAVQSSDSRVLLDGKGGDEWLGGGYGEYKDGLVERDWTGLFNTLVDDISNDSFTGGVGRLLRAIGVITLPHIAVEQIKEIMANKEEAPAAHQWLAQHLKDQLKQRIKNQTAIPEKRIRLPGQLREISLLQDGFFLKNHQVRERYSATFGIETRRPYWNKAMVQLSLMLPKRLKYREGLNKYVHRQALQELLPEKVLTRTSKAEFSVTFDYHTKSLRSALTGDIPPKRHTWINQSQVDQYFDVYDRGLQHDECPWALWNLLFCDVIFATYSSERMHCSAPLTFRTTSVMNTKGYHLGKTTEDSGTTTNGKKAYKSPTLQLFGRLSHITHLII